MNIFEKLEEQEEENIQSNELVNIVNENPPTLELIAEKSISLEDISSFFTFKLFKSQQGLSLNIDGEGKPIFIRNSNSFQKLSLKVNDFVNNKGIISSIVIENAPGSILENFQFNSPQSFTNLEKNTKITVDEQNKTTSSPLAILHSNDSIVRNVTYSNFATSTTEIINVYGSSNVTIYNNTFTDITVTSTNFFVIKISNDDPFLSSDVKIYDNNFFSINGNSDSTLVSIEGDSVNTVNDIYVANNTVTSVSTNTKSLTFVKSLYGNNITIYNNSISNINTNASFIGISDQYSNMVNITHNNFNLIYTEDEIIGLNVNTTSNLAITFNEFKFLASKNGNVTGLKIKSSNSFNLINNTWSQLIASYDTIDFSNSKNVNGLTITSTSGSNVINNTLSQLSSKSKAYSISLENFSIGKVINNSIVGMDSKSSVALTLTGTNNNGNQIISNLIQNIVSTATETIGIYIFDTPNLIVQKNTIFDLVSPANLIGIEIVNSLSTNIFNNSLNQLTSNSPIYDLFGIKIVQSNNTVISNNSIAGLYSQLTFVKAISVEFSYFTNISNNTITNCKSDFSSAFGILLDNTNNITINNNIIYNITSNSIPPSSLLNNKINQLNLAVDLNGGYGLFFYKSNFIDILSNSIDLTEFWLNADETVTNILFSDNIVDTTLLTFVSMNHPTDRIFEQGSLTTNITWIANDPSASLFSIYVDNILSSQGFWYNSIPIVFGVSDINSLSLGSHEINIVLTDDKGHKISDIVNVDVVEYTAPIFVSTLANKTVLNGSLGNLISFKAFDLNPGRYSIYRNGTPILTATWISNFLVSTSIDGLNVGTYNFTFVVQDSSLNNVKGTIFVFVLTNSSMLFNFKPSSSIISNFGSKNTTLSWIITSVQGGEYEIDVDGNVFTGSWEPGTPINYSLQNLALGEHQVKFTASNQFTQVSQSLIVSVIIPQTATTEETSFIPSYSYTSNPFNILNIIKIDTSSLLILVLFFALIGGTIGFLYYNRRKQYQSRTYVNKSEKIEHLLEVGKAFIKMGNNLEAIKTFKKALRGARLINDERLKAQVQVNLGYAGLQLQDDSSLEAALKHLNEALEISKTLKDKTIQVLCFSYLGDLYSLTGDSKEAIKNYDKGIQIAVELDDEAIGIQITEKLGLYYHNLAQYSNAIRSFEQGIMLAQTIKDNKSETNFHYYKGNSLLQQNDNNSAIQSYNVALKIAERFNDITSQAKITGEIGRAYYQMEKNESKAIKYYLDSINLAKQVGDLQVEAYQNRNLAIIDFEQEKYAETIQKIDIALNFEKQAQFFDIKGDAYIGLKEISSAQKNYKNALDSARKNNEKQLEYEILTKLSLIEKKLLHVDKEESYNKEINNLKPELSEWSSKISSRVSSMKRIKSKRVDEKILLLIENNVIPNKKEFEKLETESKNKDEIKSIKKSKNDSNGENK
jgi:tetratricopeptide (TPR) repeat protein